MIDLHSHILPGIDDGPATIAESVEIARAAVSAGMRTMVATSHVSWSYRNDSTTIAGLVESLSERLRAEQLELVLRSGAEVAIDRVPDIEPSELARLTLGEGPWLLLEFPFTPNAYGLGPIVTELQQRGYRLLLAHPERCQIFHREPGMLRGLVHGGVLTSVTAGSLVGRFGTQARRFALEMFEENLAHNVTSDVHDLARRPPGVAQELDRAGLGELRSWLTEEVPAAILSGAEIPDRPPSISVRRARSRGWLSRVALKRA